MRIFCKSLCIFYSILPDHISTIYLVCNVNYIYWRVQQAGAISGFLCGLAIVSWVGFGGPKPPLSGLEVNLSNCSDTNFTAAAGGNLTVTQSEQYFYLYRISYAWTSAICRFLRNCAGRNLGKWTCQSSSSLSNCCRKYPAGALCSAEYSDTIQPIEEISSPQKYLWSFPVVKELETPVRSLSN